MKARFTDLGGTRLTGWPADFGELMADETEKWGKVVQRPTLRRSKGGLGPHSIICRQAGFACPVTDVVRTASARAECYRL